jgi:hypothetical protein
MSILKYYCSLTYVRGPMATINLTFIYKKTLTKNSQGKFKQGGFTSGRRRQYHAGKPYFRPRPKKNKI